MKKLVFTIIAVVPLLVFSCGTDTGEKVNLSAEAAETEALKLQLSLSIRL